MTAGRVILDMPNPALDRDGNPLSNAKLYFYLAGTTTPADVFTDQNLLTPLPNPVVCDGAGRFVEIWADCSILMDAKWTDANDAVIYLFPGVSAFVPNAAALDGSNIDQSAFQAALGLGTAAFEDVGASGGNVPLLNHDSTINGTWNFTNGIQRDGNPVGYLGLPTIEDDDDRTFAITERGFMILLPSTGTTNRTWTVPHSGSWNEGDALCARNRGTGTITLKRDSGVKMRIAGNGTDQDVAVASFGMAVLTHDGNNEWCVSGAGIS